MIAYFYSSGVIPLIIDEPTTPTCQQDVEYSDSDSDSDTLHDQTANWDFRDSERLRAESASPSAWELLSFGILLVCT